MTPHQRQEAITRLMAGETQADVASLRHIFAAESVTVVGASRRPNTIGYQIVDNLLRHGYTGVVYPVNPSASA